MADTFPADGYLENASRTNAEMKTALESFLGATKQLLGGPPLPSVQNATTGVKLTLDGTSALYRVQPASGSSATIPELDVTNFQEGAILGIYVYGSTKSLVLTHASGTNKMYLRDQQDLTVRGNECVFFQRRGSQWTEVIRNVGAIGGYQEYTSSDSFTVPAGVSLIKVIAFGCGGGGGGGGGETADGSDGAAGTTTTITQTGSATNYIYAYGGAGGKGGKAGNNATTPGAPGFDSSNKKYGKNPGTNWPVAMGWSNAAGTQVALGGARARIFGRGTGFSDQYYGYGGAGGDGGAAAANDALGGGGESGASAGFEIGFFSVVAGDTITITMGTAGAAGAAGDAYATAGEAGGSGIVYLEY